MFKQKLRNNPKKKWKTFKKRKGFHFNGKKPKRFGYEKDVDDSGVE